MVVTYARWPFCQRKIKLFNPELGRAGSLLRPVVVAAARASTELRMYHTQLLQVILMSRVLHLL